MKYKFRLEDFVCDDKHIDMYKDFYIEQAYKRWQWEYEHFDFLEFYKLDKWDEKLRECRDKLVPYEERNRIMKALEDELNSYTIEMPTLEEFEQYFIMYNIPYRKHIEPEIEYQDIPKLEPLIL